MTRTAIALAAALTLCACAESEPGPLVQIGGSCFQAKAPANARVELLAPVPRLDARGQNEPMPETLTVRVADGDTPLILFMFHMSKWKLAGAVDRVAVVLTNQYAELLDAPRTLEVIKPTEEHADWQGASSDTPMRRRCLPWIATVAAHREMLPAADAPIFELTQHHLSDFHHQYQDDGTIDVGRSDWRIWLSRFFFGEGGRDKEGSMDLDESERRANADGASWGQTHCWKPRDAYCRRLEQLVFDGAIRAATNADLRQWRRAAANNNPIAGLWTPEFGFQGSVVRNHVFVIERPIKIPSGMRGATAAAFLIAEGTPRPLDPGSHNVYLDINDGGLYGGYYAPLPRN